MHHSTLSRDPDGSYAPSGGNHLASLGIILGVPAIILILLFLIFYSLRPKSPPQTLARTVNAAHTSPPTTLVELSNRILPPPNVANGSAPHHYIISALARFVGLSRRAMAHSGIRFPPLMKGAQRSPIVDVELGGTSFTYHEDDNEYIPLLPTPPPYTHIS